MIKISNQIKVGLSYKGFCDYYNNIKEYLNELISNNKIEQQDLELDVLIIESTDTRIITTYYVSNDTNFIKYVNTSDKQKKSTEWTFFNSNNEEYINHLNQCEYILDLDYYLKNN